MTAKFNLIERVQKKLGSNRQTAERAVNTVIDAIADTLLSGENVSISNFGTFRLDHDDARRARNPQTGEVVEIPSRYNVRFKVSPTFRAVVNSEDDRPSLATKLPKGTK